jgi:Fe-S-cluster containining protein
MTPRASNESADDALPQFECSKCGACCREDSILITVTGSDIARISRALELSPEETLRALDFYVYDQKQPVPLGLQGIPAPLTERGPAIIALKKMENGDCIFLKDDLCMIHAIRPIVCRSFPFTFRAHATVQFWGLSAAKHICPGLDTGPRVLLADLQELSDEVLESLRMYGEFIDEWNRTLTGTSLDLIRTILSEPRFSVKRKKSSI